VVADFWKVHGSVAPNNFAYKSLSNWAFNMAVGCRHGCLFCYVPDVATIKQGAALRKYGVNDPDAEWGNYVLLRPWDEKAFLASVRRAERKPIAELKPDGNRAVMYSSTTDPYQVIRAADPKKAKELNEASKLLVRRSLEVIRDESTLNVRILTRSPLARRDFDLFQSLGNRLLLGMSIPTMNEKLARVYEPHAPSPARRLETLRAASEAGIPVYVAVAPTYPECDEEDLAATLKAVASVNPVTIFHEPINVRAKNVERIEAHAATLGVELKTDVFATDESWLKYALRSLRTVERLAENFGLADRLHLWPDKSLGTRAAMKLVEDPADHSEWLMRWWNRISEWPCNGTSTPASHERRGE
jgi:DNA repair photolyase